MGKRNRGAKKAEAKGAKIISEIIDDGGFPSPPKRKRVYEPSDRHTKPRRGDAPEPSNPQRQLDESVPVGPNTTRRVGADPETGEFSLFDETYPDSDIFHGHARTWDSLNDKMKNALADSGRANRKKGSVLPRPDDGYPEVD